MSYNDWGWRADLHRRHVMTALNPSVRDLVEGYEMHCENLACERTGTVTDNRCHHIYGIVHHFNFCVVDIPFVLRNFAALVDEDERQLSVHPTRRKTLKSMIMVKFRDVMISAVHD